MSETLPKKTPLALRAGALLGAACLLGTGAAFAQDHSTGREHAERTTETAANPMIKSIQNLIRSGELSEQQAKLVYEIIQPANAPILRRLGNFYADGVKKIDAVVAAGKLRAADADAKKQALAASVQSIAFYIEVMGLSMDEAKLRLAADSGALSREELAAQKTALAGAAPKESFEWMQEHLKKGGIARDKMQPVLAAVERIVHEMRKEGEAFELDQATLDYLLTLNLTGEQMDMLKSLAAKAASMKPELAPEESFDWMFARMTEAGIPRESLSKVIGGVTRVVAAMRSEGEKFELDAKLNAYFVSLGLTPEQIDLTVNLASRAAHPQRMDESDKKSERAGRDSMEWMVEHLSKSGVARENMRDVLASIKKIVGERRTEGDAFELDPATREQLVTLGLSSAQIEVVLGLSERAYAAASRDKSGDEPGEKRGEGQREGKEERHAEGRDSGRGEHDDSAKQDDRKNLYMSFEQQLKAAVLAGELTAEQAEKKLSALKKSLFVEQREASRRG